MLQKQSCDLHFLPPSYVNAQKVQHFAVALLTLFLVVATLVVFCEIVVSPQTCQCFFVLFFSLSQLTQLTQPRPIGEVHDQPELHRSTARASRSDCTFGACDPSRVFEGKFCFILKCGFLI